VDQRVQGVLVLAGLHAAHAELRVAPPEPLVHLLAPLRRQRLGRHRVEQLLGAPERGERLGLARLLHAPDRLGGELADLAAERAREHLAEDLGVRRRALGVVERLAQQPPRGAELLPLEQRERGLLARGPERAARGLAEVAQPRVPRHRGEPAVDPGEPGADRADAVVGLVAVGAREPRLRRAERERGDVLPVGVPLVGGRDLEGSLEREARALVVAERLLGEPDHGPERRGAARPLAREPGGAQPPHDVVREREELVVVAFLVEREARLDQQRIERGRGGRRVRRPGGRLGGLGRGGGRRRGRARRGRRVLVLPDAPGGPAAHLDP